VNKRGKQTEEETCVLCFLNWCNKQHNRNYIYERAEARFTKLKGELRWDFIAYEPDNPQEWIGIEVKGASMLWEDSRRSEFWQKLCSELSADLEGRGIQGNFGLIYPPALDLKPGERLKFREAFVEVLCQKAPNMELNDLIDIGSDISNKFPSWPREKIKTLREYLEWGEYRPPKLRIAKRADSGCKVSLDGGRFRAGSLGQAHKEAFNEVFKLKDGAVQANEQLRLAEKMGAKMTILLLCCDAFVYEDLIEDPVQNLDRHLIPDIDCIYLVDMGTQVKDKVVKIYPG